MDETASKHVVEAALLAAGRPLSLDKLVEIFSRKGVDVDRAELRAALSSLADDYASRGIELKEVAGGFRVQVRSRMRDWLEPLFEERAPRYTRALLETLALIAYRQPITRAEIEEVRGVAVSTNIVRTLIERGWVRVVGHRDVPGKPAMLGTTREFLDYFGLRRLDELPPLSELRDLEPTENPQADLVDRLEEALAAPAELVVGNESDDGGETVAEPETSTRETESIESAAGNGAFADETVAMDEGAVSAASPTDEPEAQDAEPVTDEAVSDEEEVRKTVPAGPTET